MTTVSVGLHSKVSVSRWTHQSWLRLPLITVIIEKQNHWRKTLT